MQSPDSSQGLTAVLFCDEQSSGLEIAGVTLLDRLVVAVHRAGAGPIIVVCQGRMPALNRTKALGIPVLVSEKVPRVNGPTLAASGGLLVQTGDIRELLRVRGRLATRDGAPLPIGVGHLSELSLEQWLESLPVLRASGVAVRVADETSARAAERALWASLTSTSDGLVDKVFNRPCGRPLSKLLVQTPVTPNAVSLASIILGLSAAWFFAKGDQPSAILAALVFQLSTIVDCVDGDIARVMFKESAFGKWLDIVGDQVVHVAVFASIAIGLVRTQQTDVGYWLGASAIAGAILSFLAVLRGMRVRREDRKRWLQTLIDSATNRDFSVLVLILACFDSLDWFLWLAAIGSHLFWMAVVSLQLWPASKGAR